MTTPPAVGVVEWRLPVTGPAALAWAAALGADCLQVDLGGPGRGEWLDTPGRIGALAEAARRFGVPVTAVAANHLNDVGVPAPVQSQEAGRVRSLLERLLDAADALQAPLAFVPAFRRSSIDSRSAFLRTAEVLSWAAAQAQDRGLVLASENVLPPVAARELADRVASPAFRLLLDTYNPVAAGVRPVELVAGVPDLLADQIHLKDGPPDRGHSPDLGAGNGDPAGTLEAVRAAGVPVRALVLENDYRDGNSDRARRDVAWARDQAQIRTPEATR